MRRFFNLNTLALLISLISVNPGFSNQPNTAQGIDPNFNKLIEKITDMVRTATNHDSVSFLLNQSEQFIKPLDNSLQSCQILILRGLNEYIVGNYEQAIDFYYHALDCAEVAKDS